MIDTHCHLNVPPLDEDPAAVLARAARDGVDRVIVPAYDPASWSQVGALARAYEGRVFPALGQHPWVADERFDLDHLAEHLREAEAVAVGEIGLDGKVDSPALPIQVAALEKQLELARDLDLPVILHCRGAFEELVEILERFSPRLPGVVHAFSRGPELARRFLRLGLHLGIGGAVTRPRAAVREAVTAVPLERILLETDAPSIGLDGVPPEAAEPRHVRAVAVAIAGLRGVELEAVAEATTRAATELFSL